MIQYSIINSSRWLYFPFYISRYLSNTNRLIPKNFDRKTFDYFYRRRLEIFNGNKEQMSNNLRTNIESIFQTSSIINYLTNLNTKNPTKSFSQKISLEQLNDILFFAYEHNLKLDWLTKHLIECVSPITKSFHSNLFVELINFLVLHQQKSYDHQTKHPNQILQNFLHQLELNLTADQIQTYSLSDLSLLCSAMYRLQIPLKNNSLLEYIAQHLINDEKNKFLSAVDKQNLIKILTLSNSKRIDIAQALANRFNQSFEEHIQLNLNTFSYEIVRMTMRIGIYFFLIHFYSNRFFENCIKLIELESNSILPSYRAKDIIQIMNTLIYMGYVRKINSKYMNLILMYNQMKQFDQKPERLVDVIAPLAMIDYFPEDFLNKLFTNENLHRLTESRIKEKLFFISESYKLLHSPQRSLLDQDYLHSLPHHLFGSWTIEKRRRPYFSILIQRLLDCVPNRFYVKSAFILKHFKSPDIIIHLNTEQQPQIIPNDYSKCLLSNDHRYDVFRYALEVLSEEEICINESYRPLGLFYSKARQLQKLNYIPVIIYPNDCLHEIKTSKEVFEWIIQRAKTTELLLNKN